jgi:hypothetical protein
MLQRERVLIFGPATLLAVAFALVSPAPAAPTIVISIAFVAGAGWFRMLSHLNSPERPGLLGWLERRRRRGFLRERRPRALPDYRTS